MNNFAVQILKPMLKEVPVNQLIPLTELSNLIAITKGNTPNGKIEFSQGEVGNSVSYPLTKDEDIVFDIAKIIETHIIDYPITFIKITTDDKIESVVIDVL